MSSKPREEFELAFPDCGTVLTAVKQHQYNRETRIRPEQLRPEAREAIARSDEYKRLEASGSLVKGDVVGLFEKASDKLAM
jgi:hypothetical protein